MTENLPELEIKPRLKVLIINCNPNLKPEKRIASQMFEIDKENLQDFENILVTRISSPSKDQEPSLFERSRKSTLPLPENVEDFVAIVITGSPYVAFAREQPYSKISGSVAGREGKGAFIPFWKREFIDCIRAAREKNIPMLGICYGCQEIAEALGGKVEDMPDEEGKDKEKGWGLVFKTSATSRDPLFADFPESFVVPQNHQATVTRVPEGAKVILENEYGVQGFRLGNIWGLQFHPEKTVAQIEKIAGKSKLGEDFRPELMDKILSNFLKFAWKGKQ